MDFHPAPGALARPAGPRRARRHRRRRRSGRDLGHHGDHHRGARTGGGAGTGPKPLGGVLYRHDHPDRRVHGLLSAVHSSRAGGRSIRDRLRAVDARGGVRQICRRNSLGRIMVEPVAGDGVVVDHRLRLRRIGASGVVASRAARLPLDVHEGRGHRPAGGRHLRSAPGDARTGNLSLCRTRRRTGVRRHVVPVPVHHRSPAVLCRDFTRSSRRARRRSCWRRRARCG